MGSNPTARSLLFFGVVAKWQGKGLQNPDHGFKSRRRLCELLIRAAFCFHRLYFGCWDGGNDPGRTG
jgi:hypothetical protein